jgi:hypothetical protein
LVRILTFKGDKRNEKTLTFISYAPSAMAGIFFVGGIAILSSGLALTVMTIKSEENDYE